MATSPQPTTPTALAVNIHLRNTKPEDLTLVRDLLLAGFWDNDAWALIDLHDNADAERSVYESLAKLIIASGSQFICYGDEIIGHLHVAPPNTPSVPPLWDSICAGWTMPFRHGIGFTRKLLDLQHIVRVQTDEYLLPLQPSTFLEWFTIKSEWRGKGIGLHVLNEFVTKGETRVILYTSAPNSVRVYERAGFTTIQKHKLCTSYGRKCDNWCMVYEAPTEQ